MKQKWKINWCPPNGSLICLLLNQFTFAILQPFNYHPSRTFRRFLCWTETSSLTMHSTWRGNDPVLSEHWTTKSESVAQMCFDSPWNLKTIMLGTKTSSLTESFNGFCRAKLINITQALNSTRYLSNETEFPPWEVATLNMRYLHRMFDRTEVNGPMQVWLFILLYEIKWRAGSEVDVVTLNWISLLVQVFKESEIAVITPKVVFSCRPTCGTLSRACTTTSEITHTTIPSQKILLNSKETYPHHNV